MSTLGRLNILCLYEAGARNECLLRRGVHFGEVKYTAFV